MSLTLVIVSTSYFPMSSIVLLSCVMTESILLVCILIFKRVDIASGSCCVYIYNVFFTN
jgi:hypothetical protein